MVSAEQRTLRPHTIANKVRLAVLDESTSAQLRAGLDDGTSDLELVWSGTSLAQLREEQPQVQVLLANIDDLGDDPPARMNELVEQTGVLDRLIEHEKLAV